MLRFVFVSLVCALLVLCGIEAQDSEGDPCSTRNGQSGICQPIEKCPSIYSALLNGEEPDTLCGFAGYDPIVCCPGEAVTTSRPVTRRTTRNPPTRSTTRRRWTTERPSWDSTRPSWDTTRQRWTTERPSWSTERPSWDTTRQRWTTARPTKRTTVRQSRPSSTTTETSIQSRNPGDLARHKCAEYAKSVYALVEPPTLTLNRRLVNISLCAFNSRKLIVGGTKAEPKEFPHMTAVGFNSQNGVLWLCGGTLVSENFILTAAHCTYSLNFGSATKVRVGDLNLIRGNDDARPQERNIIERIRHPSYQKPPEYHDIALLKMDKPVTFDAYARPACLPTSRYSEGSEAIATGWGRVDWTDDEGSSDLLKVTLATVPQRECNASFVGGTADYKVPRGIVGEWQICAGGNGRDTCQGDSGGPLVIFNEDHQCMYTVVGVTSLGRLCGSIVPGVFTRVFNYLGWLEDTIWRN